MNDAYENLVRVLRDGGILHRFPQLADAVWLACLAPASSEPMMPAADVATGAARPSDKAAQPSVERPLPQLLHPPMPKPLEAHEPELRIRRLRIELPGLEPEQVQVVVPDPEQRAGEDRTGVPRGPQIYVPPPASLPDRDRFLRQLKLLRRLHPSMRRAELDLRTTIKRFCEEEIPEPVFTPGFERSLNLTFLLDSSPTMDVWRTLACELFQVLQASGAFLRCRALLWSWDVQASPVRPVYSALEPLTGEDRACLTMTPSQPDVQFSARDVVFLFSDCTAQRWYRSDCLAWLQKWAKRGHLVVVNPLPTRFWPRTALEIAQRVHLAMSDVAAANAYFRVSSPAEPIAPRTLEESLALPILAPDPDHLHAWTRFMALRRRRFPGRLFTVRSPAAPIREADGPAVDFQQRLAIFKRQATREAIELARLVAASPLVNLPIVRLLRWRLLPHVCTSADANNHAYDAEVLLSGLLSVARRSDEGKPDRALYAFVDEKIRDRLLSELPKARIEQVLQTIGFYIEHEALPSEAGHFGGFVAMLRNPEQALGGEMFQVHEIVRIAARTIFRRLGGRYAELLKLQAPPKCLTELNRALTRADRKVKEGDCAAAVQILEEAADKTAKEPWGDARVLVDEWLRVYRGLLQLPRLVADAQAAAESAAERGPFVESVTGMQLAPISAGSFLMGSPEDEPERYEDEVLHRVTLSHDFWMGIHPVTQQQYQAILKKNPSQFKGEKRPVENVSWHEAVEFCQQLTQRAAATGILPEGYVFRLPTEAEWEYCCRAGTTTATAFGDQLSSEQANFNGEYPYNGAEKGANRGQTSDVGSYSANPWGLYDMHGNVWEWCLDASESYGNVKTDTYVDGVVDPLCQVGPIRVYRGGSWNDFGRDCRSAYRYAYVPGNRYGSLGFRVCLARSPAGASQAGDVTETGSHVPPVRSRAGTSSRSQSRRARKRDS